MKKTLYGKKEIQKNYLGYHNERYKNNVKSQWKLSLNHIAVETHLPISRSFKVWTFIGFQFFNAFQTSIWLDLIVIKQYKRVKPVSTLSNLVQWKNFHIYRTTQLFKHDQTQHNECQPRWQS